MTPGYQKIISQYEEVLSSLESNPNDLQKLLKEQARLLPIVEKINQLEKVVREIKDNEELALGNDPDIADMAKFELSQLGEQKIDLEEQLEVLLLPVDENDDKDIIVEIRAGAGGDESTLFAAELFRAYSKFGESKGMRIAIDSSSKSEAGGYKEVIFEIVSSKTTGAYATFKFESGVHRVQRVPETEKQGRVHTSTITVAVLPKVEEKDYSLDPKDLKIEATTSSGNGGQSVNTTYSAIRITHLPTGITAQCQDERSQTQNKEKALAVIRARVAAHFREIDEKKLKETRSSQVGTGDRSEKIRTYNFPQDRVTDHRINQNFSRIDMIMEGHFDLIVTALQKAEIELKRAAIK